MWKIKVETDKEVLEFSAKSFFQVVMGRGKLVVRWATAEGEKDVTYARIKTIVEKRQVE